MTTPGGLRRALETPLARNEEHQVRVLGVPGDSRTSFLAPRGSVGEGRESCSTDRTFTLSAAGGARCPMGGRVRHGPRSKRKMKGTRKAKARRMKRDLLVEEKLGAEEWLPPTPTSS